MADFGDLDLKLSKGLRDRQFKQRLANKMRDVIYKRTKQGIGLQGAGNNLRPKRLKKLSTSYKELRSKRTRFGEFGSPGKSNLTLSGQMLDSMVGSVTDFGVRVEVPATNRRAVVLGGRVVRQPLTNKKLAEYVQKNGRKFFGLTNDEKEILLRQIDTFIQKIIKSLK